MFFFFVFALLSIISCAPPKETHSTRKPILNPIIRPLIFDSNINFNKKSSPPSERKYHDIFSGSKDSARGASHGSSTINRFSCQEELDIPPFYPSAWEPPSSRPKRPINPDVKHEISSMEQKMIEDFRSNFSKPPTSTPSSSSGFSSFSSFKKKIIPPIKSDRTDNTVNTDRTSPADASEDY